MSQLGPNEVAEDDGNSLKTEWGLGAIRGIESVFIFASSQSLPPSYIIRSHAILESRIKRSLHILNNFRNLYWRLPHHHPK